MAAIENKTGKKFIRKIISLIIFFVIIFLFLVIFSVLIKFDVGGFGSTLRPVIKDIPIINGILPNSSDSQLAYENDYPYQSIEDAMEKISDLESEKTELEEENQAYKDTLQELESELSELRELQKNKNAFDEKVLEYDTEIVFSENAPDIDEYKKYYESINPENAEKIYKEVIKDQQVLEAVKNKSKIYSEMDPRNAAAILQTLAEDKDLLIDILESMNASHSSKILSEMEPKLAGVLTKELFRNVNE